MISVCIPVYNYDVTDLVAAIHSQIEIHNLAAEILIFDDGSEASFQKVNQELQNAGFTRYIQSQNNGGRILARQALAQNAMHDWLLFIDADSKIIASNFLLSYIELCNEHYDVLVGGRIYDEKAPVECNKTLHWKYGTQRELNINERFIFMTNNFCIRRSVFQQVTFPAGLKGYGHEDTWMGMELKRMHAKTYFFRNPVLHKGIEEATVFIEKSKNALINLWVLEKITGGKTLSEHIKIYKTYRLLQQLGLHTAFSKFFLTLEQKVLKNLLSCNPSLFLFDLYRLAYLIASKHHK